jgi:hypothetical protein
MRGFVQAQREDEDGELEDRNNEMGLIHRNRFEDIRNAAAKRQRWSGRR